MAENTTIEALIAQGNIATLSQVDPTKTFVEVGVYQNRTNAIKGNGTSYKSYAMDISQFGGGGPPVVLPVDNKNFVLVDPLATTPGVKYNMFNPYVNIDLAFIAAVPGDVIVVNPGTYFVTQNIFSKPGVSFYFWEGATVYLFVNPLASSGTGDITILGNGDIKFYAYSDLGGTWSGNFYMEAKTISFNSGNFYVSGLVGAGASITIKARKIDCIAGYFYIDNPSYYGSATQPNKFNLTADEVNITLFSNIFIFHPESVQLNFNIKKYYYNGTQGQFQKDFYNFGVAINYPVVSHINIDDFLCDKSVATLASFPPKYPYSDSSFFFFGGSALSKTFITGNYRYFGNGLATQVPCLLQSSGNSFISFNGDAYIERGGMFMDLNSGPDGKIVINGRVTVNNSSIAFFEYLFSAYFISGLNFKLLADTIIDSPNNHAVQIGQYTIPLTPQVDISDCQIVNTDVSGTAPSLVAKAFGAFIGPMGAPYGTLRVVNTRLINSGITSIEGGSVGEPAEIVTAYTNTPILSIVNTAVGMPGVLVGTVTSNNF